MNRFQFKIKYLDCAMCAKKIEDALNALPWVSAANVNFNTEKIVVVTENDRADVTAEVVRISKSVEPGVDVFPFEQNGAAESKKRFDPFLPVFWVGFAVGLAGIILEHTAHMHVLTLVLMCVGAAMMIAKTLVRAVLKIVRSRSVDENLLITISVVGALAIGEGMEGLMVIMLYQIGKFLEQKAVNKTRNGVSSLVLVKPAAVWVQRNGVGAAGNEGTAFFEMPIEDVKIGNVIKVMPGELIPLDGIVIDGESSLDLSSLTGESAPADVKVGDPVMSGSVNLNGLILIKTTGEDTDSTLSKILEIIETASERKAKAETVVSRAARVYVPAVIVLAAVVSLAFGLSGSSVSDAVYKGMLFLVVSCPCAVAISVPLSYFSGIGNASKKGILVKGTNYLDSISNLRTLVLDKTGTITTGKFSIIDVEVLDGRYTHDEILKLAYFGERGSTHPIAKAIVEYVSDKVAEFSAEPVQPENVKEIAGKGVSYALDGELVEIGRVRAHATTATTVALRVNGTDTAVITLSDTVKPTSKQAIEYFLSKGVSIKMLTGDNAAVAADVAEKLNIDFSAEMLPEDKFREVENILSSKWKTHDVVAFAGDGINDAPVLKRADIGIAMGLSGSAATVDTADIVLMNDDLNQLVSLHKLSHFTRVIVGINIWATLAIKLTFVILGLFGITGLAWAVFADVGLTMCTILNSLRVLAFETKSKDNYARN